MNTETITARAHTTKDGLLNLSLKVAASNADVLVELKVSTLAAEEPADDNG